MHLKRVILKKYIADLARGLQTIKFYTMHIFITICLLQEYVFSEDLDPQTGEYDITTTVYPDPLVGRYPLDDLNLLPKIIRRIYQESVNAYNKNLPMLTSIGIRATIEAICVNKEITEGNLKKNIDQLARMDFMTNQEAELLHLIRFMGNASAHELEEPLKEELTTGLDIIETTLRNAYVLPEKAIALSRYKKT